MECPSAPLCFQLKTFASSAVTVSNYDSFLKQAVTMEKFGGICLHVLRGVQKLERAGAKGKIGTLGTTNFFFSNLSSLSVLKLEGVH